MSVRLAISNIGLSPFDHDEQLRALPELGIEGLEVAPSRIWKDTWPGPGAAAVSTYRRSVEAAGLKVIGLHSLFFDHRDLGLFLDQSGRTETLDFLTHLSAVCRDLGGRTLVWGGGRNRGTTSGPDAYAEAVEFMKDLSARIEPHGTVFCFEPLGPEDTDFLHTARDALNVVEAVDHPAMAMQLDAKALVANRETGPEPFAIAAARLVHFHANEPGLGPLGTTGEVDHEAMGRHLRAVSYQGFVSSEQRMLNADDPLADIAASAATLRRCYRTVDGG